VQQIFKIDSVFGFQSFGAVSSGQHRLGRLIVFRGFFGAGLVIQDVVDADVVVGANDAALHAEGQKVVDVTFRAKKSVGAVADDRVGDVKRDATVGAVEAGQVDGQAACQAEVDSCNPILYRYFAGVAVGFRHLDRFAVSYFFLEIDLI
jgi:hypothetical protein